MSELKERLIKLLTDFRYESSMGIGKRSLGQHHIEALTKEIWCLLLRVRLNGRWMI